MLRPKMPPPENCKTALLAPAASPTETALFELPSWLFVLLRTVPVTCNVPLLTATGPVNVFALLVRVRVPVPSLVMPAAPPVPLEITPDTLRPGRMNVPGELEPGVAVNVRVAPLRLSALAICPVPAEERPVLLLSKPVMLPVTTNVPFVTLPEPLSVRLAIVRLWPPRLSTPPSLMVTLEVAAMRLSALSVTVPADPAALPTAAPAPITRSPVITEMLAASFKRTKPPLTVNVPV